MDYKSIYKLSSPKASLVLQKYGPEMVLGMHNKRAIVFSTALPLLEIVGDEEWAKTICVCDYIGRKTKQENLERALSFLKTMRR